LTEARRVLPIEDDQSVRWILGETLSEMLDVEILEGGNGVEGLALALADSPDVVLMDKVMPGMDGLTFCRELRANPTSPRCQLRPCRAGTLRLCLPRNWPARLMPG